MKHYYDDDKRITTSAGGGMGLGGVLGVVFIVLKLVGVIDWPWVWVLAPFWISLAIGIIGIIVGAIIIFHIFKKEKLGWWDK